MVLAVRMADRVIRQTAAAAALVLLVSVAACAPYVMPPGTAVRDTAITGFRYYAADGAELPFRSWLPENRPVTAVIVALHGFNEYSNSFAIPGEYLSRRGIALYAYDQRGFGGAPGRGLWAGNDAYARDAAGFAREVRNRHPDIPLYLLGESMGGAVVLAALARDRSLPVDGVILVAPAVWGRSAMPWYQRWLLEGAAHTVPWLELTGRGLDRSPTDNMGVRRALYLDPQVIKGTRIDTVYGLAGLMDEALEQAAGLKLPALVLYGRYDRIIPPEPLLLMLGRMPATTRAAFYEHGYHMLLRDLHGEKPLLDIIAWIGRHDGPLSYGVPEWRWGE